MYERFYATKNDANVPVVYDWEDIGWSEEFPGGTLWQAKRLAAHLNGKHVKKAANCPECQK